MSTDAPNPERKRWTVPEPKPRAARPRLVRPVFADEDNRIAYARWLVGCGMEARAAAKLAARRPAAEIASVLKALDALKAVKAKGPR